MNIIYNGVLYSKVDYHFVVFIYLFFFVNLARKLLQGNWLRVGQEMGSRTKSDKRRRLYTSMDERGGRFYKHALF